MRYAVVALALTASLLTGTGLPAELAPPVVHAQAPATRVDPDLAPVALVGLPPASVAEQAARDYTLARFQADLQAVETFRPAYPFWQYIFTIPDGRISYGSAEEGRLVATFPSRTRRWDRDGIWEDPQFASLLDGRSLSSRMTTRRDQVADLLEPLIGPVISNPTRGLFLLPNAERYGGFLSEWGAIYERFGVPPQIGLAQAVLESGLDGRARSPARALGFCQWLSRNWDHLNRLAPNVIEAYNQTTQAPYCAAYLQILATMYGSFIPALSEHHAGGVNVGRTVINGERLGGTDAREQYLLGSEFARELRDVSIRRYAALFRTYGPRSFLYAEMVFGNTLTVTRMVNEHAQERIYAMRAPRSIALTEITSRAGISTTEAKRFNPALVRQVPNRANVYLPSYVPEFGEDVAFWHRPADPGFAAVLNDFVHLDASVQQWHEPSFDTTLQRFAERFAQTNTEEGTIMSVVLRYVIDDLRTSRRAAILEDFRTSGRILQLFQQGVRELGTLLPGSD